MPPAKKKTTKTAKSPAKSPKTKALKAKPAKPAAAKKVKKAVAPKVVTPKAAPAPASSGLALARLLRSIAEDKKAADPIILNVEGLTSFTDYFLICSAASEPQLKVVADFLEQQTAGTKTPCLHREGTPESRWIILDFNEVYVHVMHPEQREYYGLEHLWKDAKLEK